MKTNIRFVVAAVILAAVAALGFSRGAWAGPLMAGTVPGCSMTDTAVKKELLDTCYAKATFYGGLRTGLIGTLVDNPSGLDLPNPVPGGGGPLVVLSVADRAGNNVVAPAFMTLCFPDPTGVSVVFRWWSTSDFLKWFGVYAQPARWVVVPTYHTGGQVCTWTWITGIFREIY